MASKFVLPCLLGMMSLFCVPTLRTATQKVAHDPTPSQQSLIEVKKEAARDYAGEELISDGKLVVTATSSTYTSLGQSFSLTFSTGGQGWCDTTQTFLLAPDDSEFEKFYTEISAKTSEEREQYAELYEKGEYDPPHFNSYVFSLTGSPTYPDIVIPKSLTRNHIFNLDIVKLGNNLVESWTNINSITIPDSVEAVYSDSFQNIPSSVVFNVEASEKPDGWADDWNHGATVNYGYTFPEAKVETYSKGGAGEYGDKTQNFILGWYPKNNAEQQPLTLEYKVTLPDGSLSEPRYFDFSPTTDASIFECVGFDVSTYSKSLFCDIPLNMGERVVFESCVFHNIYRCATRGDVSIPEPNYDKTYSLVPKQGFTRSYDVEDFIKCEFTGLTIFSGYTAIDLDIDVSDANVYEHLKPSYYKANLSKIEDGSLKIRYRLTSLTLCSFRITYADNGQDVTKDVKIVTPVAQYILDKQKDNRVSFLLKDNEIAQGFSAKKIREVSFVGLYITVDLMGERSTIARSNALTRFGFLSVMPYQENAKLINVNVFLSILAIAYLAVFVALTVLLYFYLKNKYKNDEFRRMKNKPFIIKAVLFLIGSMIVLFDIVFIALRGSALNNAIVVYNPVDAYIIILSVLSVVIIGYFIKYLVGVIKTEKERRRVIKLKLNEDVEDDGTN